MEEHIFTCERSPLFPDFEDQFILRASSEDYESFLNYEQVLDSNPSAARLQKTRRPAMHREEWIIFAVEKKATLHHISELLKETWLECCGHLSQFERMKSLRRAFPGYNCPMGSHALGEVLKEPKEEPKISISFEKILSAMASEYLRLGDKWQYAYDMGTTTEVILEVLKVPREFEGYPALTKSEDEDVFDYMRSPQSIPTEIQTLNREHKANLLARNDPTHVMCELCVLHAKKPWSQYNPIQDAACVFFGKFYCFQCAKKIFESETKGGKKFKLPAGFKLPDAEQFDPRLIWILNTPRNFQCGYTEPLSCVSPFSRFRRFFCVALNYARTIEQIKSLHPVKETLLYWTLPRFSRRLVKETDFWRICNWVFDRQTIGREKEEFLTFCGVGLKRLEEIDDLAEQYAD